MNITEAILLLRKVKAHCPSQVMDDYTPEAWAEVLDDISFRDANEAVVRICKTPLTLGQSRYIEPGHIIGEVQRMRRQRLADYGPVELPADIEPGAEVPYRAAIRQFVAQGALTDPLVQPSLATVRAQASLPREITQQQWNPKETA